MKVVIQAAGGCVWKCFLKGMFRNCCEISFKSLQSYFSFLSKRQVHWWKNVSLCLRNNNISLIQWRKFSELMRCGDCSYQSRCRLVWWAMIGYWGLEWEHRKPTPWLSQPQLPHPLPVCCSTHRSEHLVFRAVYMLLKGMFFLMSSHINSYSHSAAAFDCLWCQREMISPNIKLFVKASQSEESWLDDKGMKTAWFTQRMNWGASVQVK